MKKWIKRNCLYIAAVLTGAILTPFAIQAAAEFRGYSGAVGGEFLLIPLFLLIVQLGKEGKNIVCEIIEIEEVRTDENYGGGTQASESIR